MNISWHSLANTKECYSFARLLKNLHSDRSADRTATTILTPYGPLINIDFDTFSELQQLLKKT